MSDKSREIVIDLPILPVSWRRESVLEWRTELLARASRAAGTLEGAVGVALEVPELPFVNHEKLEVTVEFYLRNADPAPDDASWPDIDNMVKEALDALQGALFLPGKQRDPRRLFRSDKQVYRLVAEKHHRPAEDQRGGRLIVRPYRSGES